MSDDGDEMPIESDNWDAGDRQSSYYQKKLHDSERNPLAQHGKGALNKLVRPSDMPWEESPHGRLKHVMNGDIADGMDVPAKGTDVYIQEIEPGSRSGKHRHMSEELVYVLEGEGYDHHWDPRLILNEGDTDNPWEWEIPDEHNRFEWTAGDVIYIPTNTIHQHFNPAEDGSVRLLCCQARVYNQLGYGFNDLEQLEPAPGYEE